MNLREKIIGDWFELGCETDERGKTVIFQVRGPVHWGFRDDGGSVLADIPCKYRLVETTLIFEDNEPEFDEIMRFEVEILENGNLRLDNRPFGSKAVYILGRNQMGQVSWDGRNQRGRG